MTDIFGVYNLRARIASGITLFAPILLHSYLLVPDLRTISCTFIITIITFALVNLFIATAKTRGSAALIKCFPKGLPAQQYLLPADTTLDKFTKQRYYDFFKAHLVSFNVSNNEAEMKLQAESAIKWLIARTRNPVDFSLIAEENANLGFSYNLLSLKPCGILLSVFLLTLDTIIGRLTYTKIILLDLTSLILCIIISVLFLLIWIFLINKKLVYCSAKKYAHALLSACDSNLIK